jgi:hypothetical protein
MHTNCSTIIVGDFNIKMLIDTPQSKTLRNYMDKYEFKKHSLKIQPLIIHKYIIYGLMHQHNNVTLHQQKLIEQIIKLYIFCI